MKFQSLTQQMKVAVYRSTLVIESTAVSLSWKPNGYSQQSHSTICLDSDILQLKVIDYITISLPIFAT
ncbi:hypothetical protein BofuT4_uP073610.1 [Botrytis cinerea T4]|uniref:Uncharacterized protein n=1 Tax=Botryotinia fuckeliana (strain T4) TaxID=999810 RepID=G2XPE3_BOTF4|nr:hypothetical protein BofuT4_uP073610.1 [Botrytis cinerea T4]